jgi:hypothetical protein
VTRNPVAMPRVSRDMRSRLGLFAVACLASSGCVTARAAPNEWRRVVLVELFTSEGCSSCPTADAFVRELPSLGFGRDKVIPLTFHVDYWDGLGWKDRFANPDFTARQEWYARATKLRSPEGEVGLHGLYTPQLVIDGAVHLSGGRRQEAIHQIERAGAQPPLVDLKPVATVSGSTMDVTIEATARPNLKKDLDWRVVVALALRSARTPVTHGENKGETLDEAAITRVLSQRVSMPARPGEMARVRLTKPGDVAWADLDVVVFAQAEDTGAVGAAVQLAARDLTVAPAVVSP